MFFCMCYILYNNIFFLCCCKVQYLVDILIKAKALVLNRNYISTHFVIQMKKKSYIKFYFSFIYNYLNWLSYIHKKKNHFAFLHMCILNMVLYILKTLILTLVGIAVASGVSYYSGDFTGAIAHDSPSLLRYIVQPAPPTASISIAGAT